MKINNKSVQGIFKYDSTLSYEKGDFIIKDDSTLWVAEKDVAPGEDYFIPYLADKVLTKEEYDRNDGTDGYVSAALVHEILESMIFGISSTGDGYGGADAAYNYSPDELFRREEINNAIVHFPRATFPALLGSASEGWENGSDVFIHQYAYTDPSQNLCKVQVLIDPDQRSMWVRSYINSKISSWSAPLCKTTDEIAEMVESIQAYSEKRIADVENIITALEGYSFFKDESITGRSYYTVLSEDIEKEHTIVFYTRQQGEGVSIRTPYSITINPQGYIGKTINLGGGDCTISVAETGSGVTITLNPGANRAVSIEKVYVAYSWSSTELES